MKWKHVLVLIPFLSVSSLCYALPAWEIANPRPLSGTVVSLDIPGTDTIWATNDAGLLIRSLDAGRNWVEISLPDETNGKLLVDFANGNFGYVAAISDQSFPFGAIVYRTGNGGNDWTRYEIGGQNDPFAATTLAVNGETVLIGGISPGISDQATVYRLADEGWVRTDLPGDQVESLNGLSLFNQTIGYTVGENGYLASTNDAGRTWHQINTGLNTDLFSVNFASPTTGWIGCGGFNSAHLYKTVNAGGSWQEAENLSATSKIISIHSFRGNGAVAISRGGGEPEVSSLMLTTDGRAWNTIREWERQLFSSLAVRGEKIWFGGDNGFLALSDGGDESQLVANIVTTNDLIDISFANGAVGWAVGELGTILKSFDGGYTWELIETFPPYEPVAVVAINHMQAIVACRGSREVKTSDGGESWHDVNLSNDNVTRFDKGGNSIYATCGGSVSISHDSGRSWVISEVRPGGTLLSLEVVTDQLAFASILRDSVFVTENGGAGWTASTVIPPGARSISYLGENFARAAVETEAGTTIWATLDNWRHRERIHSLSYDVKELHYYSEDEGLVLGEGGGLEVLSRGTSGGDQVGLHASNPIRSVERYGDWIWACGEGGLIARWGEDWLGVSDDKPTPRPTVLSLGEVWPNPTNGQVRIRVGNALKTELCLFSIEGRIVGRYDYNQGNEPFGINLNEFPDGVYYLNDRYSSFPAIPILLLK